MSRRASISQADITRLIKAALAAGLGKEHIAGVKLTHDGAILLFGEQKPLNIDTVEPVTEPKVADDSWSDVDAA